VVGVMVVLLPSLLSGTGDRQIDFLRTVPKQGRRPAARSGSAAARAHVAAARASQ
jgi:hypothetical protein